jgi:sec-independent protein translocase protein TatB
VIDLGISKMALIGVVALIVIGPEKLPRVARTVGALMGKAQRYVADVKAEVSRSMELDELKKMKDTVTSAAKDVESSIQSNAAEFEKSWSDATKLDDDGAADPSVGYEPPVIYPSYSHPRKHWRVKRGATPQWFKARSGTRTRALSGAARVARFRPHKPH